MTIKEQIIQDLATNNILDCQTLTGGGFWSHLSDKEKREVSNAIFENIKQNSEGWTLKKVRTINFYIGKGEQYERWGIEWLGKVLGFSKGYLREDEILLVHHSAQIQYDWEGFLIRDYNRIQSFDFFTPEQKTELRRLLNPTIVDLLDSQFAEPIKPPLNFSSHLPKPTCQIFSILIILGAFITSKFRR